MSLTKLATLSVYETSVALSIGRLPTTELTDELLNRVPRAARHAGESDDIRAAQPDAFSRPLFLQPLGEDHVGSPSRVKRRFRRREMTHIHIDVHGLPS